MNPTQLRIPDGEIVVDLFAGGGGGSEGIEQGLGRPVDIAINHDADAVSMHQVNHPHAQHYLADVYEVDPVEATGGRPVRLLHASPDCTHFSQARGGQPRDRKIRALSWVVHKWCGKVRPRVVTLENVRQILHWSPLVAKRDKATGRVLRIDGSVAGPGERTPIDQQCLVPDKRHLARTWTQFVAGLRSMGYAVQWRQLRACDYGAPTSRDRLFLVARCDGEPIVWPEPTHAEKPLRGKRPWRTAAECIDWAHPCPSIFTRKRPLADATLRRIAKGVHRYVLDAAEPFIVSVAHGDSGGRREYPIHDPMGTITGGGIAQAVVSPTLVQTGYGERAGQAPRAPGLRKPLGTVVAGGGKHALISAFLEQANGGFYTGAGRAARDPMSTVCGTGSQQRLVTACMVKLRGTSAAADVDAPLHTISAGGEHHALVECQLAKESEANALRVAAFLVNYYGNGDARDPRDPLDTVTTRDRLALVTVTIQGTPYIIVDIGLRMLQPRELYRAQGFRDSYIIERGHDGRRFTKSAQVRMCGNSVSPAPMAALVRANLADDLASLQERAA